MHKYIPRKDVEANNFDLDKSIFQLEAESE